MAHCTPHTLTKVVHRNCQTTLLSYSQKKVLGLCTYATKPDKNCTTYTSQLLQYSMAKYKVQPERSAASKQLVYAFCASANMASQQCLKTIMNIIQVLWRTAPTVAVPARAREPENSAPTDLQEGYKIDKYMYVYKRKKIQLIHVTMDNTYIMLDAKLFLYVLQHGNRHTHHMYACTHTDTHTHTSHVCMHTHTHTHTPHTHVTCMHAHTHTHTHTHTHHTHTHVCMHTHTHTHVTCMHAHTHTHVACMHTHTLHVCMHTHTHTHTHTHRMYACTNIRHMYACTHTHVACMHTHTRCMYACTHTHTSHVCMHTHTRRMYAHTHTLHVCMHTHTHVACMHAHTHTHRLCTMFQ